MFRLSHQKYLRINNRLITLRRARTLFENLALGFLQSVDVVQTAENALNTNCIGFVVVNRDGGNNQTAKRPFAGSQRIANDSYKFARLKHRSLKNPNYCNSKELPDILMVAKSELCRKSCEVGRTPQ